MSAFDTTQYLSGELFVFTDQLLGETYKEDEDLAKVEIFIKAVIKMIVTWLDQVPKMTKTLQEMEAVQNLFLVDPKAAILEAYAEIIETLGKLFGNCGRALHFFNFYDVNQTDPKTIKAQVQDSVVVPNSFGVVVNECLDEDFVSKRHTDQQAYTDLVHRKAMMNRNDIKFGYILNWVQYFTEIGGFDAIMNFLQAGLDGDKEVKVPFVMIS
jgi:hypothetical protein